MILVCGGIADPVTALVCARIEQLQCDYRLLDFGAYPNEYTIDWRWNSGVVSGVIACSDWTLDLGDITGVYVRYVDYPSQKSVGTVPAHLAPAAVAESQASVTALLEYLPCAVANRYDPSLSNQSKPYQALIINETGLKAPETLITSDPIAAKAFIDQYDGDVIFKSLSGVRSIVRRPSLNDWERLELLRNCPVQFQRYIPGDNIRVHVVEDVSFATRAKTTAVDYRYASLQQASLDMQPTVLPPDIHTQCVALSRRMGLLFSGIDLKETEAGEYFCFEVNPSPGFIFYERHTGQAISTALVEVLRRGAENSRPYSRDETLRSLSSVYRGPAIYSKSKETIP